MANTPYSRIADSEHFSELCVGCRSKPDDSFDFSDISNSELGRPSPKDSTAVYGIFAIRYPLKVVEAVVARVAIFMVNDESSVAWSAECFKNMAMNLGSLLVRLSVSKSNYLSSIAVLNRAEKFSGSRSLSALHALDSSMRADLIEVVPVHRLPDLFVAHGPILSNAAQAVN